MESIIEKYKNPLGYSGEIKDIIFETLGRMLMSGPEIWTGEKEKTPVSLDIPHEIIEEISVVCKEKKLVQWDFETKLFTHLVLEGLTFIFLLGKSRVLRDSLNKEANEKVEEFYNEPTRTDA